MRRLLCLLNLHRWSYSVRYTVRYEKYTTITQWPAQEAVTRPYIRRECECCDAVHATSGGREWEDVSPKWWSRPA